MTKFSNIIQKFISMWFNIYTVNIMWKRENNIYFVQDVIHFIDSLIFFLFYFLFAMNAWSWTEYYSSSIHWSSTELVWFLRVSAKLQQWNSLVSYVYSSFSIFFFFFSPVSWYNPFNIEILLQTSIHSQDYRLLKITLQLLFFIESLVFDMVILDFRFN